MDRKDYISLAKMIGRHILWSIPIMFVTILAINSLFFDYQPLEDTEGWLRDSLFMATRFTIYLLPWDIYSSMRRIKRGKETRKQLEQYDGLYTER